MTTVAVNEWCRCRSNDRKQTGSYSERQSLIATDSAERPLTLPANGDARYRINIRGSLTPRKRPNRPVCGWVVHNRLLGRAMG